jgi:hypothetical protein
MRVAAVRLGRPAAAAEIADLLAQQARVHALQPPMAAAVQLETATSMTWPT